MMTIISLIYQYLNNWFLPERFFLDNLQRLALNSFRVYCDNPDTLPVDLYVIISDILQGAGHVTDIFPYFIRHAKEMFPHLDCMDELKQISDLRNPANW